LNTKKYLNIMYDMDGTLFSSNKILIQAYRNGITELNKHFNISVRVPELNEILQLVGQPSRIIYKTLWPELNNQQSEFLSPQILKNLCEMIRKGKAEIFPNVSDTLKTLNELKFRQFIVSNGGGPYLNSIIDYYNFNRIFEKLSTLSSTGAKSKSELLKNIIESEKINKNETIMVGDRIQDYEAAKNNNIDFIGVDWGHGNNEEIKNANYIISSFEKIIDILTY